jgi:NTE family protein
VNLFKQILIPLFFLLYLSSPNAQELKTIELKTKNIKLPYGLVQKVPGAIPEIGVALSGGGARGISQIGVIKALEEEGININAIAGTSIGSIIGGVYSSGYTVEEIDSIVTNTNWDQLLSINNPSERRELFIDQKIGEDRSSFTLRLNGLTPILPTSFNEGLRLSNYLTLICLSAPVVPNDDFDNLLIRYRAVCTNLVDGSPVVLSGGSLARAMRASSSVSFLLSPVLLDSLTLVDGGLVSNIPVTSVIDMGVDYVIAVNTTSDLRTDDELELPWNIADQTVSIPMKRLEQAEVSKANFNLQPDINGWSSTNFNNVDSLIFLGYNSTKKILPVIKSEIDSLTRLKSGIDLFWLKNIKPNEKSNDFIKPYLINYSTKDSVSSQEIFEDMIELYNTGRFDSLSFSFEYDGGQTNINFNYTYNPIVTDVVVNSDGSLDSNDVNWLVSSLKGIPFEGKKIFSIIRKIIVEYKRKGYILFNLKNYNFNIQTGLLTFNFEYGTIKQININSETNKTVVNREFNLKVGDKLLYSDLEEGLMRLRSTALFDDISLNAKQMDDGIHIDLSVNEKISSIIRFGFLVDNTYNAQFAVDVRDVNLFYSGTELGLFLFGGASNRAYILEHISYRILNTYLTYKFSAYYKFNDIDVYSQQRSQTGNTFTSVYQGKYRQIFYGGALSAGAQLEKFGKLIFTGKYQYDEIKNKEGNVSNPYETKIVSLKISGIVDDQNKYPYPEDGIYFNGFYETAQSFLGGDESYILVSADLKYYFKIASRHVFAPRIQIGFGDKTLPLSEHFTLGGLYSFFGAYENQSRGRQIFLTSLMYQYKLPFKIFFDTYTWFRYDLGSTWEVQEQIKFKDLKHGIGGAVSFDTPIGPADFSIGRSFIISQGLTENSFIWGDVLFYFSIGHAISF